MELFTQTLQNVKSNYIPHGTVTCDERNPPWIDEKIKKLVLEKNDAFLAYSRDENNTDLFNKFQSLQAHLKITIEESKQNYYSRLCNKLLDSKTSLKSYWSVLKIFVNNGKISCIPLLFHNGKFILDFKENAEFFNDFLTRQCSFVNNNSKLPLILTKKKCKSLSTVEFSKNDIVKIIRNLNSNKAHGHNMISIQMLKFVMNLFANP